MSDSVRPHRWQPTRLLCPWDSPGKNTGVGCHFLLQCMKVKSESEVTQSCPTQRPHGLQPTRLLHSWDFPGKSTGVGSHCLLRSRLALGFKSRFIQDLSFHDSVLNKALLGVPFLRTQYPSSPCRHPPVQSGSSCPQSHAALSLG